MSGMQNKTIRKLLGKKIEDWISSIDDEDLRVRVRQDVIVTGGSIASMIMGDPVNDFDVYFRTKDTTKAVAEYYAKLFNKTMGYDAEVRLETLTNIKGEDEERVVVFIASSGVAGSGEGDSENIDDGLPDLNLSTPESDSEATEKGSYRPVFLSENAITLSHKVQIITRFFGSPEEIHRNYDFVHAKCYYDHDKNELSTPLESLRAMQSKTLRYEGSLYPICSLFRMRKFINRGWKISAGEILKMAFQVSEIDLSDRAILREQLTGVDALYFNMLIRALADVDSERITADYVVEVIDRIFSGE